MVQLQLWNSRNKFGKSTGDYLTNLFKAMNKDD